MSSRKKKKGIRREREERIKLYLLLRRIWLCLIKKGVVPLQRVEIGNLKRGNILQGTLIQEICQ